MNYSAGFSRAWVFISAAWVVSAAGVIAALDFYESISWYLFVGDGNIFSRFDCGDTDFINTVIKTGPLDTSDCSDGRNWALKKSLVVKVVGITFFPPLALLILGSGVAWVARGFAKVKTPMG